MKYKIIQYIRASIQGKISYRMQLRNERSISNESQDLHLMDFEIRRQKTVCECGSCKRIMQE